MNVNELFFGAYARLYTYSGISVILIMMLIMSVRLFASRRRKAYLSLTVSVAVFIVQYVLLIALSVSGESDSGRIGLAAQALQVAAFIMINRSIYQLYNSTKKRHHLYYFTSLFVTLALALFRLNVGRWFDGTKEQLHALGSIGLDLYLLLLVSAVFIKLPPYIGQARTLRFGLFIFFIVHLSQFIHMYMLENTYPILTFIELYLPFVYFFTLFLLLFERIVELMQASYRSSITDGLTGLFNRRYFLHRAAQYIRHGYPISVLFSDIDNFKKLNDTKGHQAGDEALKAVAQIMLEESEEIGLAGRFGGEEMVVLVTDSSVNVAELSEKIRARIEADAGVTVSIGYSKSRKGLTAEQVVSQADQAMYAAKTTGKNKVVPYTQSLRTASAK